MTSFLGVPIVIRGEAYGNLYLTDKSGGAFDGSDEESVVVLAEWASIAIGNARLYERVESRREELERAVRGLEATTAIARAVGGETDLERVLELVAKRGRALVRARSFAILLPAGEELRLAAVAGELPVELIGTELAPAGTAVGEVLRGLEPERLSDLSSRVRHGLDPIRGEARSALLAPLVFRGRAMGILIALEPSHEGVWIRRGRRVPTGLVRRRGRDRDRDGPVGGGGPAASLARGVRAGAPALGASSTTRRSRTSER